MWGKFIVKWRAGWVVKLFYTSVAGGKNVYSGSIYQQEVRVKCMVTVKWSLDLAFFSVIVLMDESSKHLYCHTSVQFSQIAFNWRLWVVQTRCFHIWMWHLDVINPMPPLFRLPWMETHLWLMDCQRMTAVWRWPMKTAPWLQQSPLHHSAPNRTGVQPHPQVHSPTCNGILVQSLTGRTIFSYFLMEMLNFK